VRKPLAQSKIALVTTAGLHHIDQRPFDILDPRGDPTFRIIDNATIETDHTLRGAIPGGDRGGDASAGSPNSRRTANGIRKHCGIP
jgi:hypothetical protein